MKRHKKIFYKVKVEHMSVFSVIEPGYKDYSLIRYCRRNFCTDFYRKLM